MSKIRIRSDEELEQRKKIFFEIVSILENFKLFYFLQGGVLLGARREKNFIKWDWDIEISVFAKDLIEKFDIICSELKKNNFFLKNYNSTFFCPKISFDKQGHSATSFSIIGWKYSYLRRAYTRKKLKIPIKYMNKMDQIDFFQKTFFCPGPIDSYLEYSYNNWKKPIRSEEKEIYLSKKFYTKNFDIFDFFNTVISYFKNLIQNNSKGK